MSAQRLLQPLRARPLVSNLLTLLSGTLVGQLFMAIATLLTARLLGNEGFGRYAACFALATLTSTAFNFGMDGWLLQQGRLSRAALAQEMSNSLLLRALLGVPWFVLLLVLAPRLNPSTYPPALLAIVAGSVWLDGLFAACLSTFKAALRNHITSALLALSAGSLLLLTLGLAWRGVRAVEAFAWIRLAISLATLGGTLLWLLGQRQLRAPAVAGVGPLLRAAAPFALSELLYFVYLKADITIIGARLNEEAVGLYAPASNLLGLAFLVPSALYTVMVPVLSRQIWELREGAGAPAIERLRQRLGQLALATLGLGLALTLALFLVAQPLVHLLLGDAYRATGQLLQTLSLLLLFKAGSFAAAAVLVAADWQRQRVRVQAVAALVNVLANLLLVRQIGIAGVAWVYVLTEALLFAGYALLTWRWWRTAVNGEW